MPGWWYQESTCPFPQPTLQVRPQFPRQDLLGVEGKVRIMDSLALTPLPAADSSGEAGPGGLSALASPDQGRGLKGVPGGRKRQTDSRTRRPGAMQARQKACDPDWAVGGAPRLQLRSLAVQCRLFLAGVVIPTVWVRGHRVSVGALGPTPGLPEPATQGHWAWRKPWDSFLGPCSCRSRALVLKAGHTRAGAVCRSWGPRPRGEPEYSGCVCATGVGVGAGDARGMQGRRPVLPLFPRRAAGGGVVAASLRAPPCRHL